MVVATAFIYLTVHRRIAGDVPICLKFARKVTNVPSENADFDRFRLIVPQQLELVKKSLIITNKVSTLRFGFPSNRA